MKKILFVKGKSQYDSTMIFVEEMIEVFREQGMQADILDGYDLQSFAQFRSSLTNRHYDVIFAINGMLLEKDSAIGQELFAEGAIYCTMLMDHPYIHHERMSTQYPWCFVLSPDMHHVNYLEQYYPDIWCEAFLPHGGCASKVKKSYTKRSIDVSFMGSYTSPERVLEEMKTYPELMQQLYMECIQFLQRDTGATLEQAVLQVLSNRQMKPELKEVADVVAEFRIVDRYIRAYYRDLVVRTLVENEITVDVYGDGWENMKVLHEECLRMHGRVGFGESMDIVADSKISLNVMPWFKAGSHDRVFSSMLCGSICLTDGSTYLEEEFADGQDLVFYSLNQIETLPECVRRILRDDVAAEKIAIRGQVLAENAHTWRCRAEELLAYLQTVEELRSADMPDGEMTEASGQESASCCVMYGDNGKHMGFRRADWKDQELLFQWVNDSEVRRQSFHTDGILWEEHVRWFEEKMHSEDSHLLIWVEEGIDKGMLRLDYRDGNAFVNYSVQKDQRGTGTAGRMIGALLPYVKETMPDIHVIVAEVKTENHFSRHIFEKYGYRQEQREDRIIYTMDI